MRTDELVSMLAREVAPVDPAMRARRISLAMTIGFAGAGALMAWTLGFNPALHRAAAVPMFWVKIAFVAAVLAIGASAMPRLGTPGARAGRIPAALGGTLVALWAIAALVLLRAAPGERIDLLMGDTWRTCPYNIAVLSVPAFVAALWAMKGLAPTRLHLAGAGAGLVSAAIGALVYTLHCPEVAPPFIGVWYVLGMLIPTAAGALIGPRVLRW